MALINTKQPMITVMRKKGPKNIQKSDFHIHSGTAGYTERQYFHGIIIGVVFVKKKCIVNLNQTEIKYQY